jgi:phosphate transport system permease protein
MRRRKIIEFIFLILMKASVLLVTLPLFLILVTILFRGIPAIDLAMITETPKGGFYLGKEGGVLNAIAGSFYLSTCATLLAMFISLPVVIFLNIYERHGSNRVWFIRLCMDVMAGVPSIVFGAFGFLIMLFFGLKVSLLAGIITVTLLILPVTIRSMDEMIRTIPLQLLHASYSLGATRIETAMVAIKRVLPGLMTALLLSFARAIGDAASVIFTAGYTDNIPKSLAQPAATLPLAIFFQLSSPVPEVRERAYAAALILTFIILLISYSARYISNRFADNNLDA